MSLHGLLLPHHWPWCVARAGCHLANPYFIDSSGDTQTGSRQNPGDVKMTDSQIGGLPAVAGPGWAIRPLRRRSLQQPPHRRPDLTAEFGGALRRARAARIDSKGANENCPAHPKGDLVCALVRSVRVTCRVVESPGSRRGFRVRAISMAGFIRPPSSRPGCGREDGDPRPVGGVAADRLSAARRLPTPRRAGERRDLVLVHGQPAVSIMAP